MTKVNEKLVAALGKRKRELDKQIGDACLRVDRDPSEVTVVAVTKMVDNEIVRAAYEAGFRDFGENRPQALVAKREALPELDGRCHWHLIGTLQRNKVRSILRLTDLIHSVDSMRLLKTVSRIAGEESLTSKVLLQVNLSGEASKQGFTENLLLEALAEAKRLPGIELAGLMTMAPLGAGSAYYRELFTKTKELRDRLIDAYQLESFNWLSMGMSQDFVEAVEAGATHIRVGSQIFSDLIAKETS